MEKRLHNTRHAARQARNSGKAGSSNATNATSGASSATAERMTITTTTTSPNSKAANNSAPSPPPGSASHQREQTAVPTSSSSRYRQHQQSAKQSDSSDEDDDDEEMEDDSASPALATPTSPPSTPVTPTAAAGSALSSATSATTASSASPEQMYEGFQAWALRTYGDSAKTKTVTRKKYQRILKILKGEEQTSAENSKFRFWVKAKGFKMGLPPGHPQQTVHKAALAAAAAKTPPEQLLFVPCSKVKKGGDGETTVYKRVAVVENFFEIIYGVHVEMDGRGGKHAGQKRTYKAIAELYAFLPREAVTHFLMSCSDCQKRMHLTNGALSSIAPAAATANAADSPAHNSGNVTATPAAPPPTTAETASSSGYQGNSANGNNAGGASCGPGSRGAGSPSRDVTSKSAAGATASPTSSAASSPGGAAGSDASATAGRAVGARIASVTAADLDFSVPITTAYLKHMRSLGLSDEDAFNPREDSTLGSDELSDDEATPNYDDDEEASPDAGVVDSKETSAAGGGGGDAHMTDAASTSTRSEDVGSAKGGSPSASRRPCHDAGRVADEAMDTQQPLNMTAKPATSSLPGGSGFAGSGASTTGEHGFADRGQSPPAAEPDDLSAGTKDEDEEDDDDEQDKLDISSYDPERLKAFNMFVRLFVDENLDRMVPISRQPKEKIQAIIDSCSRQFPEFAERARKRIRTYLKSCRRTKRTRDLNGWDGRTAVPHLTSPLAEQILASACENETNNAKRMRLGLQPLPMELDIPGRSTTPGYHVTVGVGGPSGAGAVLTGVPSSLSVNSSAASVTNNVSSQLISRLTAPIVTSNASTNGLLATSSPAALSSVTAGSTLTASSAVTTSGVDVSAVCPFHMHHHHQQQFHQHFTTASANPSVVSSNGILTSPGTVTSSSSSSSPVNSFMNGVTGAASPHTPHTHHHHKCFNNVSATNGVGLAAAAAVTAATAANGHHYHVHHRHAGSLGGTSVSSSSCNNSNNGPTDLSVKKCVGNGVDRPAMALKYSLNPNEVNAVKQLIAGYRESAAFLLRSADELEQLLLQQN